MYICMRQRIHSVLQTYTWAHTRVHWAPRYNIAWCWHVSLCVSPCVCICQCVCACVFVCVCVRDRGYTHVHTHKATSGSQIHYRMEPPPSSHRSSHRGVKDFIVQTPTTSTTTTATAITLHYITSQHDTTLHCIADSHHHHRHCHCHNITVICFGTARITLCNLHFQPASEHCSTSQHNTTLHYIAP